MGSILTAVAAWWVIEAISCPWRTHAECCVLGSPTIVSTIGMPGANEKADLSGKPADRRLARHSRISVARRRKPRDPAARSGPGDIREALPHGLGQRILRRQH